ncbi:MAG: type IV secretory system conjugative DNA transfer family protein, partial [Planktothrix sp.]
VKLTNLEGLTAALYERIEEAERMLPLPDPGGNVPPQSPDTSGTTSKYGSDPLDAIAHQTGRSKRVFSTGGIIGKRDD